MSVRDMSTATETESIRFEFDLEHPPEKVWRALTEPELVSEWLLPVTGLRLEEGAAFTLRAPPQEGWDGTVQCRLLEIDGCRKLSYSWVVGEFLDTVVTFTLEPAGGGTRLRVVQSGFGPHQKQNRGGARYGWKLMGGRLVDLLARLS